MKAESILHLIEKPTNLSNISSEELDQLRSNYPYCQNIQFLHHRKFKNNLTKTANNKDIIHLYIPPTPLAHANMENALMESTTKNEIKEINLEIQQIIDQVRDIDKVISEEQPLDNVSSANEMHEESTQDILDDSLNTIDISKELENPEKPSLKEERKVNPIIDAIESELNYIEVNSPLTIKKERKHKPKKHKKTERKIQKKNKSEKKNTKVPKEVILTYKKVKKKKSPKTETASINKDIPSKNTTTDKKVNFLDWLDSLEEVSTMLAKRKTKKEKKKSKKKEVKKKKETKSKSKSKKSKKTKSGKKAKKKEKLQEKIDSSVSLKEGVISTTLAELMAKQGHKKEAIKIYKQLKLNNPEKSSYFAAQIKKLK